MLEFQLHAVEHSTVWETGTRALRPVVHLFGRTGDGRSVCVHVHGFWPTMHVAVPFEAADMDACERFRDAVVRCICADEGVRRLCLGRGATSDTIVAADLLALGRAVETERVVQCARLVSARSFYTYEAATRPFVELELRHPAALAPAAAAVLRDLSGADVFTAHVPYELQFLVAAGLHGMDAVSVAHADYRPPGDYERTTHCDVEADASFAHVSPPACSKTARGVGTRQAAECDVCAVSAAARGPRAMTGTGLFPKGRVVPSLVALSRRLGVSATPSAESSSFDHSAASDEPRVPRPQSDPQFNDPHTPNITKTLSETLTDDGLTGMGDCMNGHTIQNEKNTKCDETIGPNSDNSCRNGKAFGDAHKRRTYYARFGAAHRENMRASASEHAVFCRLAAIADRLPLVHSPVHDHPSRFGHSDSANDPDSVAEGMHGDVHSGRASYGAHSQPVERCASSLLPTADILSSDPVDEAACDAEDHLGAEDAPDADFEEHPVALSSDIDFSPFSQFDGADDDIPVQLKRSAKRPSVHDWDAFCSLDAPSTDNGEPFSTHTDANESFLTRTECIDSHSTVDGLVDTTNRGILASLNVPSLVYAERPVSRPEQTIHARYAMDEHVHTPIHDSEARAAPTNTHTARVLTYAEPAPRLGGVSADTQGARSEGATQQPKVSRARTLFPSGDLLTYLSLDVFAANARDPALSPDPAADAVAAVAYAHYTPALGLARGVLWAADATPAGEAALLRRLVALVVNTADPDVLVAWKTHALRYLARRWALVAGDRRDLCAALSRRRSERPSVNVGDGAASPESVERVGGRVIVAAYKVLRTHLVLGHHDFAHAMERVVTGGAHVPVHAQATLAAWHARRRPALAAHLMTRAAGCLFLLARSGLAAQTAEGARIIGLPFASMLSRGSQFRTESLLARLCRAEGMLMLAPGTARVRTMRAPEGTPLAMEPVSGVYTDPVVVLDFASLYPSVAVAYNICYSTLLGRCDVPFPRVVSCALVPSPALFLHHCDSPCDPPCDPSCDRPSETVSDGHHNGHLNDHNDHTRHNGHFNNHTRHNGHFNNHTRHNDHIGHENCMKNCQNTEISERKCVANRHSAVGGRACTAAHARRIMDGAIVTPGGHAFVPHDVREGVLGKIMAELLAARTAAKDAAAASLASAQTPGDADDALRGAHALDTLQRSLKLAANVMYGYAGASYSGRMPSADVADAIVQTGRATLVAARETVERGPWRARVLYGDTDSLFVHLPGRSVEAARAAGEEIARAVTDANPAPVRLRVDRVYCPGVLLAKKRYYGWAHAARTRVFDAKGIETVRRDTCPLVARVLQRASEILFRTADVAQVRAYVLRTFAAVRAAGSLGASRAPADFVFCREVRLGSYATPPAAAAVAARMVASDPHCDLARGERVPFLVALRAGVSAASSAPGAPRVVDCAVSPHDFCARRLVVDGEYYVARQLVPVLARVLGLVAVDVPAWERLGAALGTRLAVVGPMDRFVRRASCLYCGTALAPSKESKGVCPSSCDVSVSNGMCSTPFSDAECKAPLSDEKLNVPLFDKKSIAQVCFDPAITQNPNEGVLRCEHCAVAHSRAAAEVRARALRICGTPFPCDSLHCPLFYHAL